MIRSSIIAACALSLTAAHGEPSIEIHYAPGENLERIDIRLIDSAQQRIDAALYVLSDWAIIDALKRALARGVEVRVALDCGQRSQFDRFHELEPWTRCKSSRAPMHLKSYSVDGAILRTGAASMSASGLKDQNNDLVLIRSPDLAKAFEAHFEKIWTIGARLEQ